MKHPTDTQRRRAILLAQVRQRLAGRVLTVDRDELIDEVRYAFRINGAYAKALVAQLIAEEAK